MLKPFHLIIVLLLLTSCSKPDRQDLETAFYDPLTHLSDTGIDLSQYIRVKEFELLDYRQHCDSYLVTAIPKINITRSLNQKELQHLRQRSNDRVMHVWPFIRELEVAQQYDLGYLDEDQVQQELMPVDSFLPQGTLMQGDMFWGFKRQYTFRRGDDGWVVVSEVTDSPTRRTHNAE